MPSVTAVERKSRLQSLLGFLERDPGNTSLIADAAQAAFDEQSLAGARELLARHAAIEPLPSSLVNLEGLIALSEERFEDAIAIFSALTAAGGANAALKFNLAWAYARMEKWPEALELLDADTVAASPRAPSLKIHVLHHMERYDEALAEGETLARRFPDDAALMGALATLAMDAEKMDLARTYAERGAKSVEGTTALGFMALAERDVHALSLFDKAIAQDAASPRAWIGKGLGLLVSGDAKKGADAIDRGASLFGDHIGSWIASGWAHFAGGDNTKARESFERAMAIDPNFSECHGALAVMDLMDGKPEAAERECEIALRLDKKSFGGALAKMLLLDRSGNPEMARRVRDVAFATPLGPRGETLAQILAQSGGRLSR